MHRTMSRLRGWSPFEKKEMPSFKTFFRNLVLTYYQDNTARMIPWFTTGFFSQFGSKLKRIETKASQKLPFLAKGRGTGALLEVDTRVYLTYNDESLYNVEVYACTTVATYTP